MKLRRLLGMSPAEISSRAGQLLSKWADRTLGGARRELTLPSGPVASPIFFPSALHERTPVVLDQREPDHRHRVLASAEALLCGRFDLLGYRALSFGDPIDWHLDAVAGRRAPDRHGSLIDPLDVGQVGDSKVVWELNRHQWLIRLGQAYRLTGDERYAAAFARHLSDWLAANPRGHGVNWSSSLEVAFRLMAWAWALHLFQGSHALTRTLEVRMLAAIDAHAVYVARYLSYYFSPNTHLTGEALGLFHAGVLFPALRRAARWRALAVRILEQESARQILPDGVYFEQSTYYQRYEAEIYLQFLVLADLARVEVSPHVHARVGRLLDALLLLLRPDGSMPQIGDSDGGRLLPLDLRGPADARDLFSTAAVYFERADYAWAADGLAPETIWLLGPSAAERFDALRPAPPLAPASQVLADGGYAVLRSAWTRDADQVIFDVGPLGCPFSGAHGHADLLSVQCTLRGRSYVVDPGTFTYTPERRWRDYFRGTAAHSTVDVDGAGQATPLGPFSWERRPGARLLRWESAEDMDFADAEHRAFERLAQPVVHRRRVILLKTCGYCVIVDDLEGTGEHQVDLRFQLAPMPARLDSDLWLHAGSEPELLIGAWATAPFKATLSEGGIEPPRGWVSPDYGVKGPAPMLAYSTVATVPLRIVTMLLTSEGRSSRPAVFPMIVEGVLVGVAGDGLGALRVDGDRPRWDKGAVR